MASITIPRTVRIGRLAIDTLHCMNKNSLHRLSGSSYVLPWCRQKYSTVTEEQKNAAGETQPPVTDVSESEKKLKAELELLNKDLADLKERNEQLNDKYKRALADGENLRVRLTKQIQDAKLFGIQSFCKDLLDVADILGKATESVPKDEISDRNPHLKNLFEGLTMTEAQLHKVFKKHGLVSMNPLNEKFDPNKHEALFQQDVENKEPGTIIAVSKLGYELHERIVRPALVGVVKG